jgi:hypothetical protein
MHVTRFDHISFRVGDIAAAEERAGRTGHPERAGGVHGAQSGGRVSLTLSVVASTARS